MNQLELPHDFPHKPPKGYFYKVHEHKRNVHAIFLHTNRKFDYNSGKPTATIWGFYDSKKKCYYAPINATKQGDQVDIDNTRSWTSMPLKLTPLEAAFL